MDLTTTPETIVFPQTHYVFVEKIGPFMETAPTCWGELYANIAEILEHNTITEYFSLYKVNEQIYRAGVGISGEPKSLPNGLEYTLFPGGKYNRFVLTGSYANLPEACGKVFEIVEETHIPVGDNFYIEHYLTDPRTTPEDELKTGILVPTE